MKVVQYCINKNICEMVHDKVGSNCQILENFFPSIFGIYLDLGEKSDTFCCRELVKYRKEIPTKIIYNLTN